MELIIKEYAMPTQSEKNDNKKYDIMLKALENIITGTGDSTYILKKIAIKALLDIAKVK